MKIHGLHGLQWLAAPVRNDCRIRKPGIVSWSCSEPILLGIGLFFMLQRKGYSIMYYNHEFCIVQTEVSGYVSLKWGQH